MREVGAGASMLPVEIWGVCREGELGTRRGTARMRV